MALSTMVRFTCPTCGKSLQAPEEKAGAKVMCPGCKGQMQVPANSQVPETAPSRPAQQPAPPVAPPPWYYARAGERHGPFTTAQLKQLAHTGEFQPTDSVWKDGMPEWRPASQVEAVFPPTRTAPISPVPPPPAPSAPRASAAEPGERKIDLAMLAVLDTLIEDPIIFKWAKQQLDGDERKFKQFQRYYLDKKKKKEIAHTLNLVALFGIGGLHRFYLGDPALGIAHLLTMGFCWIGTLIDIFAINKRVNDANVKVAMQTLEVIHVL